MKTKLLTLLFICIIALAITPTYADVQEDHGAEILNIVTTDDSRYAAMSLAASQIDIDTSAQYLQIGLATARLDETNGAALTIGFGFGTGNIKLTHTRAKHTKGIAIGGVWKF